MIKRKYKNQLIKKKLKKSLIGLTRSRVLGFNEFLETQFSEKERKVLGDMLLKINNLANAYEPQVDIEEKK